MKHRGVRFALIGAAVALAIYIIVGIVRVGNGPEIMPSGSAPIVLQGGNVQSANHTISSRSWSLRYKRAELSPDGIIGSVDGVHDGIVYRNGKPYVEIDAAHVSLNAQTLDFTAVGRVHVQMLDDPFGRSFDTDYVTWTNDAKLLEMQHPSYLHVGGETLKIQSITVDFVKNQIHLGAIDGAVRIP